MPQDRYDCLKLDTQLCFPLYACSREVVKRYTPYLDKLDLTYTQYVAMMVLWEHKSVTVKQAGVYLHLDSGTLTPLFKRLEEKGLITRSRSQTDERSLIVSLTKQGEKLKEQAVQIPEKIAGCITLEPGEAKQLYTLLHKLLDQLS